jgi:hypothetical protein
VLKFILVVVLFAAATYFLVRAWERGAFRGSATRVLKRPPKSNRGRPQRPLGPDDDPEFLRDLNRKRKRKEPPDGPR